MIAQPRGTICWVRNFNRASEAYGWLKKRSAESPTCKGEGVSWFYEIDWLSFPVKVEFKIIDPDIAFEFKLLYCGEVGVS